MLYQPKFDIVCDTVVLPCSCSPGPLAAPHRGFQAWPATGLNGESSAPNAPVQQTVASEIKARPPMVFSHAFGHATAPLVFLAACPSRLGTHPTQWCAHGRVLI